jgi:hypothetical protein
MNPSQPQFGSNPLPPLKVGESRNGVTIKPGFDSPSWKAPTGGASWELPKNAQGERITQRPLPINASTGGAASSRYAQGTGIGFGGENFTTPPIGRPDPNQGTTVARPAKPAGPTAPKTPRIRGGFGGILGGGGAFGKIK